MNDYLDHIKPSIRAMHAYQLKQREYRIKLNQNENPYDVPQWLKTEILTEFCELQWNRYPSFNNDNLKSRLSEHLNVPAQDIMVGNGSNELLQIVISVVLAVDSSLLIVPPTFTVYQQLARVAGATIIEVELQEDWSFPVDQIVAQMQVQKPALTLLCTPNSPTGSLLSEESLQAIASAAPGFVVVDEAYHEFSESRYIELLSDHPNLIITRTFSKALGIAGLRVGYLVARQEIVRELNKGKLPYNLNLFSEFAASKVLEHYDVVEKNVELILAERDRVYTALQAMENISVTPSAANFLMFKSALDSTTLLEKVLRTGVLIRDISGYHPRLANQLRVSVGSPVENDALLAALGGVF
jgi:histidinol-phosphate aminotransferase